MLGPSELNQETQTRSTVRRPIDDPTRVQLKQSTSYNRYPYIFLTAQAWAREIFGPTLNEGALRILSFGCADGSEMATLRAYFPSATIFGCDVDGAKFAANKAGQKAGLYFASNAKNIASHGPYDLIFAHSVLCQHPVKHDIESEFPFSLFTELCEGLHQSLRNGGLLALYNCSYRFSDLAFAREYRPVRSPLLFSNGWVPKWTSSHQQLTDIGPKFEPIFLDQSLTLDDIRDCIFEKERGAPHNLRIGSRRPLFSKLVGSRTVRTLGVQLRETLRSTADGCYWMKRAWSITAPNGPIELQPWWERASADMIEGLTPSVLGLPVGRQRPS